MKNQPIIKTNYQYGFHNPETSVFKTPKGLSREIVEATNDAGRMTWKKSVSAVVGEYQLTNPPVGTRGWRLLDVWEGDRSIVGVESYNRINTIIFT